MVRTLLQDIAQAEEYEDDEEVMDLQAEMSEDEDDAALEQQWLAQKTTEEPSEDNTDEQCTEVKDQVFQAFSGGAVAGGLAQALQALRSRSVGPSPTPAPVSTKAAASV